MSRYVQCLVPDLRSGAPEQLCCNVLFTLSQDLYETRRNSTDVKVNQCHSSALPFPTASRGSEEPAPDGLHIPLACPLQSASCPHRSEPWLSECCGRYLVSQTDWLLERRDESLLAERYTALCATLLLGLLMHGTVQRTVSSHLKLSLKALLLLRQRASCNKSFGPRA